MKKIISLISILFFATNIFANDDISNIRAQLKVDSDEITKIVLDKTLSKSAKDKKFVVIVDRVFDYKVMSRLALGRDYKRLNKKQKKLYVRVFRKLLRQSYMGKFYKFSKDKKIVIGNIKRVKKNKFIAKVDIVSPTNVNDIVYKMYKTKTKRKNKNRYLIYEVSLLGISITKSYRAQFKQAIRANGIDKFLSNLAKKVAKVK